MYNEYWRCDFCLRTTKSPIQDGWVKLMPMGVKLSPTRLPTETHFCSEAHLGMFLDWREGNLAPQEVERIRKELSDE